MAKYMLCLRFPSTSTSVTAAQHSGRCFGCQDVNLTYDSHDGQAIALLCRTCLAGWR